MFNVYVATAVDNISGQTVNIAYCGEELLAAQLAKGTGRDGGDSPVKCVPVFETHAEWERSVKRGPGRDAELEEAVIKLLENAEVDSNDANYIAAWRDDYIKLCRILAERTGTNFVKVN